MSLRSKWDATGGRRRIRLLLVVCCLLASCSNDMEKVQFFDRRDLPHQTLKGAHIYRSESGRLQLVMEASDIKVYRTPENKTVYPKGLKLHFYSEDRREKAFLTAGYGISFDDRNLMKAAKGVVIVDYRTGDTSYLDNLIWNSAEHRIYSNNPVRSVNGQRVTLGDGFVSDENFENPQILHQRGTVLVNE